MDNDTSLINVLIAPNRFFGALGAGREKIGLPALIVLVSALIAGAGAYLVASSIVIDVPDVDPATMQMIAGVGGAIFAGFVMLLGWVIGSLIMHVIVKILGGTGSFWSTLSTVGYGNLPQVFSGLLTVAVVLIYHPDLTAIATAGPAALGTMAPAIVVATVVGFVVLVWSVVIETYGLVHAHDLSFGRALVAPVVMLFFSMLFGLI
ncbi:MAG: YIP1 family protein [Candidatus Methanomethylophilaceae archaeon]|nr:YIP1 family protein [Candidatus Methanomethylophilaceae archaeon]